MHDRDLHLARDRRRARIERTAKDEGKTQDVVDLVRIVGTAGRDDRVAAHGLDVFRQDFGVRVGEREDQRIRRHLFDHRRLEHATGRQAEEHVGALDHLGERALVGGLGEARLVRIHQFDAALIDHAGQVGEPDVFDRQAEVDEQVDAGERRGARAADDELDLLDVLADDLEPVERGRADDDRGAVLVIVKHRNLHARTQLAFDVEAFRRLDVFEVDAAEGRLQRRDHFDELVRVELIDFDVEHIDARELLEQHRLALHHRLGRERADVAEAEHRGAVGDHGHQVTARGVAERVDRIGDDLFASRGHTRRIRQCEIALVGELLGGGDREFSGRRELVVVQRGLSEAFAHLAGDGGFLAHVRIVFAPGRADQ